MCDVSGIGFINDNNSDDSHTDDNIKPEPDSDGEPDDKEGEENN